jgi:hypothetical protein
MKCSDYKLSTCRGQVFDRLCEIWKETKESTDPDTKEAWAKDIWRKANTLQAVAQYWHSAADATRKQRALALMREGYDFYLTKKAQEWWVDDFGWWGGFFGDLRDYTYAFPLDPPFSQANLLTEIEYCYDRMLVNLDANQGGIWNQPGGEKNTITNDWALNLASNLFNITGNAKYKTFAENQYKWLMTGKYQGYSPQSWSLYTSTGLILWLPGAVTKVSSLEASRHTSEV